RVRRSSASARKAGSLRAARSSECPAPTNSRAVAVAIAEVAPSISIFRMSSMPRPAPEAGGKARIHEGNEPLNVREACLKSARRHARILSWIDGASCINHDPVEVGEQVVGFLP